MIINRKFISMVCLYVLIVGLAEASDTKADNKYLFIELKITEKGEIAKGTPPYFFIDFPTYDICNSKLSTVEPIKLSPEIKAILGNKFSISGDLGSGISSYLTAINSMPFVKDDDFSILDLKGDNATISLEGSSFTLSPGSNRSITKLEIRDYETGRLIVTVNKEVMNHGEVVVNG